MSVLRNRLIRPARLADKLRPTTGNARIMKTHRSIIALAASTLLAFASLPTVADEIYRWVDENGVVNFTQQKPRDTEVETIRTTGSSSRKTAEAAPVSAPAPASAATGQPLSAEQEKMLEGLRAAERARQDEIAQIKSDNCQQSRDILSRLTLKNRIRVKDANGDYSVMPEDERQRRISEAQENIALYCVSA